MQLLQAVYDLATRKLRVVVLDDRGITRVVNVWSMEKMPDGSTLPVNWLETVRAELDYQDQRLLQQQKGTAL